MLILLFMIRSTHKWIQFDFFSSFCCDRVESVINIHWPYSLHIPILLILRCMQLSQFSVASSKSIRIILHRCYCFFVVVGFAAVQENVDATHEHEKEWNWFCDEWWISHTYIMYFVRPWVERMGHTMIDELRGPQ